MRLDRLPFEDLARSDWRISIALRAWHEDMDERAAANYLHHMRRIFAPDPAHMTSTLTYEPDAWRIADFMRHPFVMDGAEHRNTVIAEIRELPARIAAEETYATIMREAVPSAYMVSMPARVYRRVMLPFFGPVAANTNRVQRQHLQLAAARRVTRVVTLIHPVVTRATLAEVVAQTPIIGATPHAL